MDLSRELVRRRRTIWYCGREGSIRVFDRCRTCDATLSRASSQDVVRSKSDVATDGDRCEDRLATTAGDTDGQEKVSRDCDAVRFVSIPW